jgi:hypothetical protein
MKYVRYDAPPEMRLRFHFRNRFGEDILWAREYDPVTGIGIKAVPDSDNTIEFFEPNGYVEIDGHTNPSEEALQAVFNNSKAALQKEIMDKVVKQIEQEVHYREGAAQVAG